MTTTLVTRAILTACLVGLAPAAALAQRDLPPEIVRGSDLSAVQTQQLGAYVAQHAPGLSGDQVQVKRARLALLAPLKESQVSISFRLAYARALVPVLEPLLKHQNDLVAVNALQIAGELGTPDSPVLLAQGLTDGRAPVRYGAAFGHRRLFEVLASGTPALTPKQAIDAAGAVARVLAGETDAHVMEGCERALEAAARVPEAQLRGVRAEAVGMLARQIGERARGMSGTAPAEFAGVLTRASKIASDAITLAHMDKNEPPLPPPTLAEVGRMAGAILLSARARLAAGEVPERVRAALAQVVSAAEAAYFFAHSALGERPENRDLAGMVSGARDEDFAKAVEALAGAGGVLSRPPFVR
ncbi:MAG TPA: hypothetical protein VD963_00425 [Phycisphaerales bacterium]|nr:hypothetical protein [Phycisphaerales bacterium]